MSRRGRRRQMDVPPGRGGDDGHTFTEQEISSMAGSFNNPKGVVVPASMKAPTRSAVSSVMGAGMVQPGGASQAAQQQAQAAGGAVRAEAQPQHTENQQQGAANPGMYKPYDASQMSQAQVNGLGPIQTRRDDGSVMAEGDTHKMTDGELIDAYMEKVFGMKRRTPEEIAKEEKRRKSASIIAALGDGLGAIAKMHYIGKGAPYVAGAEPMSTTLQKRYDELDKQYRERDAQYLNAYLQMLRHRQEMERQRQLDIYRQQQIDATRARQDAIDEMNQWRRTHGDATLEQTRAHQQNQDAVASRRAEAAATNAAANATRASKAGSGGKSGGKKKGSDDVVEVTETTDSRGRKTVKKKYKQRGQNPSNSNRGGGSAVGNLFKKK